MAVCHELAGGKCNFLNETTMKDPVIHERLDVGGPLALELANELALTVFQLELAGARFSAARQATLDPNELGLGIQGLIKPVGVALARFIGLGSGQDCLEERMLKGHGNPFSAGTVLVAGQSLQLRVNS